MTTTLIHARGGILKRAASGLLGVLALATVAGAAQPAFATNSDIYCQGYAQSATKLYRTYTQRNCGNLQNIVWHASYGEHFQYCKRNTPITTAWLNDLRRDWISNNCSGFADAK